MSENILARLAHWLEIDLDKLAANAQVLRQHLQAQTPGVQLLAVVKNDAYGYGAVECARTLSAAGRAASVPCWNRCWAVLLARLAAFLASCL